MKNVKKYLFYSHTDHAGLRRCKYTEIFHIFVLRFEYFYAEKEDFIVLKWKGKK